MPMAVREALITAYATAGVSLGIEVENDGLPAQLGEPDGLAVLIRELEVGSLVALLDHPGRSSFQSVVVNPVTRGRDATQAETALDMSDSRSPTAYDVWRRPR